MSEHDDNDPGHGHSVAAWTAVVISLVGFAAGTLAYWFDQPLFVYISAGVVVLGPLVGVVLAKAGFGVKGRVTKA